MTTTDLDRWAEQQVAYGSPDYVRGYRDGIEDTVQAAKDLDFLADRTWWTNQGHESVVRLLHALPLDVAATSVIDYLGYTTKWHPEGIDYRLLARAARSTLRIRQAEERALHLDRDAARAQYRTKRGVTR